MERLTYWCDDGMGSGEYRANENGSEYSGPSIDRLAAYEDTGLEPQTISEILDSVSEWYDAHKEGRLLVLPCKVGDTVWRIKKGICPEKGACVSGDVCSEMIMGICPDYSGKPTVERSIFRLCDYNDVGKTVFRTREEAEAKLKEFGE